MKPLYGAPNKPLYEPKSGSHGFHTDGYTRVRIHEFTRGFGIDDSCPLYEPRIRTCEGYTGVHTDRYTGVQSI